MNPSEPQHIPSATPTEAADGVEATPDRPTPGPMTAMGSDAPSSGGDVANRSEAIEPAANSDSPRDQAVADQDESGGAMPEQGEFGSADVESGDAESAGDEALMPAEGDREWEPNASARLVAGEIKQVEAEIRRLLENCDNKRKRKYEGTRRWLELQEDILAMRFTGPADEATLSRVQALVARRQTLFRRLSFIVGTRYRWNT